MSEVKLKAETDYYKIVRQKLTLGHYTLPKHEKITELMKIFWDEETIKLLSYFPDAGETVSPNVIAEKSGIPRKEVKKLLKQAAEKRTIAKVGRNFSLHPLLPGVFEAYFIAQKKTFGDMVSELLLSQ